MTSTVTEPDLADIAVSRRERTVMNSASIVLVLASVCVSSVLSQLTATKVQGCTWQGKVYPAGQSFQPTPCEHCQCPATGGRAMCAIMDCFFTLCVDAVHDPTKCCPTCPNGPNCKHTDGTIIKKGDTYRPDANTVCRCPQNSFGFPSTAAMCATSMAVSR